MNETDRFLDAQLLLRPRLLVSVRNTAEAAAALNGGADIIDVKEPRNGPLGCAAASVLARIAQGMPATDEPWLTAALGELAEREQTPIDMPDRVRLGKVGLAGEGRRADWQERFCSLAGRMARPIIPAAYADFERAAAPPVTEVLAFAARCAVPFLLIDTHHKDGRGLWDWLDEREMERVAIECRHAGMGLVLAGSLAGAGLTRAAALAPAALAVRTAACAGSRRDGPIEAQRVRALKRILEKLPSQPAPR